MNWSSKLPILIGIRVVASLVASLVVTHVSMADDLHTAKLYTAKIKPLLIERCVSCHGPLKQEGELRLDAGELIHRGGASGYVIDNKSPDESELLSRITAEDESIRMPPEGKPLSAEEVKLLKEWIAAGAHSPNDEEFVQSPRDHWAFRPPNRSAVPQNVDGTQFANPIDAFLAVKHSQHNVTPLPRANKRVLIRRVYLDLIGLPPLPADVKAFEQDNSVHAWETVIDRLLASPRYGERWGRHWMDIWRYSDWYGYKQDLRASARHVWHWRDWIIESLNDDLPYDQMLVDMLAADEVAPLDRNRLRATGFLVRNYYKFNRNTWLDGTIEHTSKAFLGLTYNCARCHDHKYDPVTQEEYYNLRAVFEPHKIRTDRLPGESDIMKAGLPLAYDAELKTPTYLLEGGRENSPVKDKPLDPKIPGIFESLPFEIEPISLPVEAYYPGARSYIQTEMVQAAEAAIQKAQKNLAQAKVTSQKAKETLERFQRGLSEKLQPPRQRSIFALDADATLEQVRLKWAIKVAAKQLQVSQKKSESAQAEKESLLARIGADRIRYAIDSSKVKTGSAVGNEFARKAVELEHRARSLAAKAGIAQAELAKLRASEQKDAKKKKKVITAAAKQLAAAKKKLESAQKAIAEFKKKPHTKYQPLTKVYSAQSSGRRLAFARWATHRKNPLTARVAVNHVWMRHFGKPLVASVFDFGMNGSSPTHPELLDWLAVELMEKSWSMKKLHRLMVTSAAYQRQSSSLEGSANNTETDPDNRYLWRMNSRRLEAEAVRDSVLWVTGQLDITMGGPDLDSKLGQTTYRRSVYYRHAPEKMMSFLTMFDSASVNECYRRAETVVPQQALALMNSQLSLEQSRRLAAEISQVEANSKPTISDISGKVDDQLFVSQLFFRVLSRQPTESEMATCLQFLLDQGGRITKRDELTSFDGASKLKVAPSANPVQRARESLVHVLLNHNEFVTIR